MGGSNENRSLILRGRKISEADIEEIRQLIKEHADHGRTYISQVLAKRWDWRQDNGRFKDRACRAILMKLKEKGLIDLPSPKTPSRLKRRVSAGSRLLPKLDTRVLEGPLCDFLPLRFEVADRHSSIQLWNHVIRTYHYLGYRLLVGNNIKYLVYSKDRLIAALGWQSAVERLACRDRVIGWDAKKRQKYLHRVANNARFLILPFVHIPHLASHILAQNIRRLNWDWEAKYGYPLWLLDTFVDPLRFRGTCYRAANWVKVGKTKGFSKEKEGFVYHGENKEVYLYVLDKQMLQKIQEDPFAPLLTKEFLLSMRTEDPPLIRREKMMIRHEGWNPEVKPPFDLTEEDVKKLAKELEAFHSLFEEAFYRVEQTGLSRCYLQGLLTDLERKSVEPMALALRGPKEVRNLQRFMSEYKWDDDLLARRHKEEVSKTLADPEGVFSVDNTEIPKKGRESVAVARQYCGRLGKVENCQSGVFVTYTSPKGYALVDRRLFVPKGWFSEEQKERRKKCKVPEDLTFKKKTELGAEMIQKLWDSGLFPAQWVTCDTIFGNSDVFLNALPKGLYYLAEVACTTHVWLPLHPSRRGRHPLSRPIWEIAEDPCLVWHRKKLDEGAKGPIVAKFARLRVFVSEKRRPEDERWLFLRKDMGTGEVKYYLSNAPKSVPLSEMTRVCILRWPIEQSFQEGKSELGMDHYEHRSWPAWHRHMTFVFLAQLFLLRIRIKLKKNAGVNLAASKTVN